MHFILPENLKNELIPYDQTLKKLAKSQPKANSKPRSKSAYPLGNPEWIIPADVAPATWTQAAIRRINDVEAAQRYVSHGDSKYILYHYESVWVAVWLAPEKDKDNYLFGYAYAFKDTESTRKKVDRYYINTIAEGDGNYETKTIGRTSWAYYSNTFSVATIQKDPEKYRNIRISNLWKHPNISSWGAKSCHMHRHLLDFENKLIKDLPKWQNAPYGYHLFTRLTQLHPFDVIAYRDDNLRKGLTEAFKDKELNASTYIQVIKDNIYKGGIANAHLTYPGYYVAMIPTCIASDCTYILDTPFFRSYINTKLKLMQENFYDYENTSVLQVTKNWHQLSNLVQVISLFNYIYPNQPVDYYRTHIDVLEKLSPFISVTSSVVEWLRTNLPFDSFLNMIQRAYESRSPHELREDRDTGEITYSCYDLRDSINLLGQVIAYQKEHPDYEFKRPKRWRLTEFHDTLMAETWKFQNKNESLPQGLFPEPIKVERNSTKWTLFQPVDVHQLAQWGRAVRNCVGGASNYRDGIKKKEHFIVLCMVDNDPRFTIQLKLSNGVMSVVQIADVCNKALDQAMHYEYQQVFQEALKAQAAKLDS